MSAKIDNIKENIAKFQQKSSFYEIQRTLNILDISRKVESFHLFPHSRKIKKIVICFDKSKHYRLFHHKVPRK